MKKQFKFDIEVAVKKIFGEGYTVDEAKKFIKGKISQHKSLLPTIIYILEDKVIKGYKKEIKNKDERHSVNLMEDENYQIKPEESIIEKIWRSQIQHEKDEKEHGMYTIDNFHYLMEDIIRFRILCNYLRDIEAMKKLLPEKLTEVGYFLKEGPKDFINLEPGKRTKGHRAVHFIFRANLNNQDYLFEVQLMTILQHAWDKKDHHLVYEFIRNKKEVPLKIKIRSYAMSELLYVADDFFDSVLFNNQEDSNG